VQTATDLRPEWFSGRDTVGVTAGTSTPDSVIEKVEAQLRAFSLQTANAMPAIPATR
jgi:4-hydroxy-3-methylbut-2-enyl diphosphate reductase